MLVRLYNYMTVFSGAPAMLNVVPFHLVDDQNAGRTYSCCILV